MMNLHGTPHNDVRLLLGLYLFLTARIHMCYWLRKRNGVCARVPVCLCTIFAQGTKRKGVFFSFIEIEIYTQHFQMIWKNHMQFFGVIRVLSSLFIVNMCVHVCSCVFSSSWVLVSRYKIIHLSFYRIYPVRSEFRKIPRLYTYVFHYKSQNIHIFPYIQSGQKVWKKVGRNFFSICFWKIILGMVRNFRYPSSKENSLSIVIYLNLIDYERWRK